MRCCQRLLRSYSAFLCKYPLVFLILTPVFLVICAICSFVPGVGPELPDFSKPTEGFEPRGTSIMKRIVTQQETLKTAINYKKLKCTPSEANHGHPTTRRKRSVAESVQLCKSEVYEFFSHAKTVYESGGDMMNVDALKAVCRLEENIIRSTPGFELWCVKENGCCPSMSLGSYIASRKKRTSCEDITDDDVDSVKNLLTRCSADFFSGKLEDPVDSSVSDECKNNTLRIKDVFKFLVDKDFLRNTNVLKNTLVISPVRRSPDFFNDVYKTHLENTKPKLNGVKLVAFDFTDFKFDQFNKQLLLDAIFPVLGLICVAIIILIYTHSVFVMFLTVFSVLTSFIIAYFIYHQIFRLTFFPFLNITTFIFLVGIGADDAFVFADVWNQAKHHSPSGTIVDWMEYTLKHAALSMFVTSFTTSSAFYANVVSDITAIRLFGIFAGTSILIKYALMITWFPAGVVVLEKRGHNSSRSSNPDTPQSIPLGDYPQNAGLPASDSPSSTPSKNAGGSIIANLSAEKEQRCSREDIFVDGPSSPAVNTSRCAWYGRVRSKCSKVMTDLFRRWIPKSLRVYFLWLFVLLAIGIGMLSAATVSPGLQRPKSSDFQVFSDSHILEQYDLKYKDKFRIGFEKSNYFWVHIFLGIKAEDNGNYLDPKDFGHLSFDPSFDISSPEAQEWLLKLCSRIRKQPFFATNSSWQCSFELFKETCSETNHTFPFSSSSLAECSRHPYRTCSAFFPNFYFDNSGKHKGLTEAFPTNIQYSSEFSKAHNLWQNMKNFSDKALSDAPPGVRNGWSISDLRFFALQENLGSSTITSLGVSLAISFVVMLFTSMNWVISVYAILTIVFILSTTVGSLVLAGWELNILESIVISVAVGLSVDFTLHYGVAYTIALEGDRVDQVKYALSHIGPAVTLAAITTFIAGVFMMFSTVLAYFQLGQFLTLVMAVSWVYATFFFISLCYFAGPVGHFGEMNSKQCFSCKVYPIEKENKDEHL